MMLERFTQKSIVNKCDNILFFFLLKNSEKKILNQGNLVHLSVLLVMEEKPPAFVFYNCAYMFIDLKRTQAFS
jgi:hypothetical protein